MKLSKKIVVLVLVVAIMISGLNVIPEKVKAESASVNEQKVERLDTKNLLAWRSSDKATKIPEMAVDGSRIIDSWSWAVSDGNYIYYNFQGGIGNLLYPIFKRSIKTGKEIRIGGDYIYTGLKLYKEFLLCDTYHSSTGIIRLSKNGESKEFFNTSFSPIGIGKFIYCCGSISDENPNIGIYRMDINGRNRKLVKKDQYGRLGISGNKLYYAGDYDEVKKEWNWFDFNSNKLVKKTISADKYDPISKTKFIFNDTTVKAGKYKNGKWQYKTILKHKMEKDSYIGIKDIAVCGNKLLVKITGKNGKIKLYMTDLNGKNKKLLHKGDGVG